MMLPDNSHLALERLRRLVACLPAGSEERLPTERTLSEQFGVGRRAVRRALEVLEAEGLVWRRQGSGTYAGRRPVTADRAVREIVSGTDFMEVMEVRLRLEPQLAQLAALRARPADVLSMRDLVGRIARSDDADARELWDGALHRLIASSAGNTLFLSLFDILNRVRQDEAWRAIRDRARTTANSRTATHAEHVALVDAIEARDPARAGDAMRRHLLHIQELLIRQTSLDPDIDAPVPPIAARRRETA